MSLTFNSDICVWIECSCCSHRGVGSLVIVFAVDFVTIFVDERRISAYNLSLITSMLNFLYIKSASGPRQLVKWGTDSFVELRSTRCCQLTLVNISCPFP